ncbi:MAG TPA: SDR family NAD(P)-dependent oxidoreductase [Burkholderiales bacterium]|nr:SDR family NAD(P)-dependent oxidoreductase [Burkholderiales bacterium]
MDLGIEGKLALVSGSTQGIGYATAKLLLEEGARVMINGRSAETLERAMGELRRHGTVYGIAADLSTGAGAQRLLDAAREIGAVDILVNNVGYFEVKPFTEISDADWNSMFELNFMSGVRLSRALLPPMLERNWGRIVFIASEQSAKPNRDMLHYAMTKTAQVSLARGLAELTRKTSVTVNSVLAAPTWSEGVEAFLEKIGPTAGKSVDEMRTAYFEDTGRSSIIQRWATAEEVAAHVVFLCSARASAINGAAQRVDGGIVRSLF